MSYGRSPRSFQEVPSEVYEHGITAYGDLFDVVQRRSLNQAAQRRYQERLPELQLNFDVLSYAIETRDLGLFRDWMRINDPIFAESELSEPQGLSFIVAMIGSMADFEPRFAVEALRYPGFVQQLQMMLDKISGRRSAAYLDGGKRVYSWRNLADKVIGLLRIEAIADQILLPWIQASPQRASNEIAGISRRANDPGLLENFRLYAERHGYTLPPAEPGPQLPGLPTFLSQRNQNL